MLDELVTIKLDKERHLRLGLRGMIAFQKVTGKNLLKGFKLNDLTLEDTAAMLWAALIHEDADLTYDNVLDMVDLSKLAEVMTALAECINQALPQVKAGARPLARKPQRG